MTHATMARTKRNTMLRAASREPRVRLPLIFPEKKKENKWKEMGKFISFLLVISCSSSSCQPHDVSNWLSSSESDVSWKKAIGNNRAVFLLNRFWFFLIRFCFVLCWGIAWNSMQQLLANGCFLYDSFDSFLLGIVCLWTFLRRLVCDA